MAIDFDPLAPIQLDDPYPLYRTLRDEAPCHLSDSGTYTVSRYEDVHEVLRDSEGFSSKAMLDVLLRTGRERSGPLPPGAIFFLLRTWWKLRIRIYRLIWTRILIGEDGDSHRQLRTVVNRAFTPTRVAAHEPRMRKIVDECMSRRREGGTFDPVGDLAVPLPVSIIGELLGVGSDRIDDFKRWSRAAISVISGSDRGEDPSEESLQAIVDLLAYLSRSARERRKAPSDDLISVLVTSDKGEDVLDVAEVIMFTTLLLLAGQETTTNLIGSGCLALLRQPDELARLQAEPSRLPEAIEEMARFDSPIQTVFRTATRDCQIAGTPIAKGSLVAALIGSANRDERRFPDPDRLDVGRDARGHLAFGFGPHFCLGASLARLEAKVAFERLVPDLGRYTLASGQPPRQPSFLVRGPLALTLHPREQLAAGG